MKTKKIIAVFFLIGAGLLVAAEKTTLNKMSPDEKEQWKKVELLMQVNLPVMTLKMQMAKYPSSSKNNVWKPTTLVRWNRFKERSGFSALFWSDFFTGCVLFTGPYTQNKAFAMLYNPWWDAVFKVQLERTGNSAFQIIAFEMNSGEFFRSEKSKTGPNVDSALAQKSNQVIPWMKNISATRKHFDDKFSSNKVLEELTLSNDFDEEQHTPVQLRAIIRAKLMQTIWKNKGVTVEMMSFLGLLYKAQTKDIVEIFTDQADQRMFELFTRLGSRFRQDMTCYGYWGNETERMYLYVCVSNPRIVCMIFVHVGKNVEFEWYDLDEAEKYLSEMQKRGVK